MTSQTETRTYLRGMGPTSYKPGETVPFSAIYRIEHQIHRMMHHATLPEGMQFPLCKRCGNRVRFFSVRAVPGQVVPFRETGLLEEFPERRTRLRAG